MKNKSVEVAVQTTAKYQDAGNGMITINESTLDDIMKNIGTLLVRQKTIVKGTTGYPAKVTTFKKFLESAINVTTALIQSGEMTEDKYNLLSANVRIYTRKVTQVVESGTEELDNIFVNELLKEVLERRTKEHQKQMEDDPTATELEKAISPDKAAQIIAEPDIVDSNTHTTTVETEDGGKVVIDKINCTATAITPEGNVVKDIEVKGSWRETAINFLKRIIQWIRDFYSKTVESTTNKIKGVFGKGQAPVKSEVILETTPTPNPST